MMEHKKKTIQKFICYVAIILLFVVGVVDIIKFDYQLTEEDGKHYFVFNNLRKYGVSSEATDIHGTHLQQTPVEVTYPSGKELVRAVKYGNLSKDEKREIARFYREDKGRIVICDFDNFYEVIPAKGWKTTQVKWVGRLYGYSFDDGEHYGTMTFYHEELYREKYKFAWEEYFKSSIVQVAKTEYWEDGHKEVIYYSRNATPYPERAREYKNVRYSLKDGNRTIYVERVYSLPEEELQETHAYVTEVTQNYIIDFWGMSGDISDETLLQFGIEKVVVVSPWIVTGAFLSVSAFGFVIYKKLKKRKEAQVA